MHAAREPLLPASSLEDAEAGAFYVPSDSAGGAGGARDSAGSASGGVGGGAFPSGSEPFSPPRVVLFSPSFPPYPGSPAVSFPARRPAARAAPPRRWRGGLLECCGAPPPSFHTPLSRALSRGARTRAPPTRLT